MKHVWVTHENCQKPGVCPICDGGISICKICGHVEGSITTECPGEKTYQEKGDLVHQGKLDLKDGKWIEAASPYSPAFYKKLQEKQ